MTSPGSGRSCAGQLLCKPNPGICGIPMEGTRPSTTSCWRPRRPASSVRGAFDQEWNGFLQEFLGPFLVQAVPGAWLVDDARIRQAIREARGIDRVDHAAGFRIALEEEDGR